jgi:hypothetical protein
MLPRRTERLKYSFRMSIIFREVPLRRRRQDIIGNQRLTRTASRLLPKENFFVFRVPGKTSAHCATAPMPDLTPARRLWPTESCNISVSTAIIPPGHRICIAGPRRRISAFAPRTSARHKLLYKPSRGQSPLLRTHGPNATPTSQQEKNFLPILSLYTRNRNLRTNRRMDFRNMSKKKLLRNEISILT